MICLCLEVCQEENPLSSIFFLSKDNAQSSQRNLSFEEILKCHQIEHSLQRIFFYS